MTTNPSRRLIHFVFVSAEEAEKREEEARIAEGVHHFVYVLLGQRNSGTYIPRT